VCYMEYLFRGRKIAFFLWVFCVAGIARADDTPDEDDEAVSLSWSGSWGPDEWTNTKKGVDVKGFADRPDKDTLSQIAVKWQKPQLDPLGNLCQIRGQLLIPKKTSDEMRPIDWYQGVTVYLAIEPESKPDWSNGMDQADTLGETTAVDKSGAFDLKFDLRKAKHDRNRGQSFQFGLALAEHTFTGKHHQTIVWSSHDPAIPSTVQMLTVPAAPELSHELALINRASGWPFSNPDGVELIRAVNGLLPLGKEQALATLEQYVDLTSDFSYHDNREIVFWIIRLLFEPIRLEDRIPAPAIAVHFGDEDPQDRMIWPLSPMDIVEDVPFMIGCRINMGGSPEHPASHILWARRHGVIRDQPLVPSTNPLAAAEAILSSPRFKQLDEVSRKDATDSIRRQALAMVKGIIEPIDEPDCEEAPAVDDDNAPAEEPEVVVDPQADEWKARFLQATKLKIHWDSKREAFVAGNE